MNPRYSAVAHRARHRCEYCRAPEAAFNFPFEVEHIIPRSAGGDTEIGNLALACRSCNLKKSNLTEGLDEITSSTAALFHPREHHWAEHFEIDLAMFEIRGRTACGRVTIRVLDMNHPLQLAAREMWAKVGLYP